MMKKSLKKMIICFFMMVGIMGAVAVPTEAKSHVNYTKIYKKFAKKQVKKKKKNLYMAVVKLDTPVLLITDHVWDGTVNMAHLYQYHKKKVRYIGYIGAIKNESFLKNELVKGRQKKMIIMQNATR